MPNYSKDFRYIALIRIQEILRLQNVSLNHAILQVVTEMGSSKTTIKR